MIKTKNILLGFLIFLIVACSRALDASIQPTPTQTAQIAAATPTRSPQPSLTSTATSSPSPEPIARIPVAQLTFPSVEPSAPAATLVPAPVEMLEGHAVVLRIHNVDKLTGRLDQLTRWLAWGAPAFTLAPDGSFWIVDVANRQTRLVHLSPDGFLLETLPLANLNYIIDVAADPLHAWVLGDNLEQKHVLVQFDLGNGTAWEAVLPDDFQMQMPTQAEAGKDWGLTGLSLDEQGGLYLERMGGAEFVQVIFQDAELIFQPVPGYLSAGHVYRFAGGEAWLTKGPLLMDEQPIDVVDLTNDFTIFFQGVDRDGGFFMLYRLGDQRYLRHYSPEGELLGLARPPQGFRALFFDSDLYESDVSIGPDGEAYALVSPDDQDVVILRLSFSDELSPLPSPTPYVEPTPLTPLIPAWETPPPGTQAEDIARETLIAFFSRLDDRQYARAAEMYGGGLEGFEPRFEQTARNHPESVEQVREYLTSIASDPEQFWQSACSTLLACLPIGNIVEVEQISETEFRFWVELTWEDGYKYVTNACCGGNPAITPFVWQFPYTVRMVDGRSQVLEPPPLLE